MSPLMCLAVVIFFEARGETIDGQYAVAEVVMNRVSDERYPNKVCDVVFEEHAFSGVTKKGLPKTSNKITVEAKNRAVEIAQDVLDGNTLGITSTHYHEASIDPMWASSFILDGKIGSHLFYTNQTLYK